MTSRPALPILRQLRSATGHAKRRARLLPARSRRSCKCPGRFSPARRACRRYAQRPDGQSAGRGWARAKHLLPAGSPPSGRRHIKAARPGSERTRVSRQGAPCSHDVGKTHRSDQRRQGSSQAEKDAVRGQGPEDCREHSGRWADDPDTASSRWGWLRADRRPSPTGGTSDPRRGLGSGVFRSSPPALTSMRRAVADPCQRQHGNG